MEALRGDVELFEKYGAKYDFDPLMLAAQGYQESRLRQDARSHVGAVGVMQIMPATGKELSVGDIHQLEPNIHGGAKYMDQLMTRYFPDANFSEQDRTLFAFASYNAGPGATSRSMRTRGGKRGLDPDKWFNNVEVVVAREDRPGDHDLRAQHLQVLRGLQARAGRPGGHPQGARAGRAARAIPRAATRASGKWRCIPVCPQRVQAIGRAG